MLGFAGRVGDIAFRRLDAVRRQNLHRDVLVDVQVAHSTHTGAEGGLEAGEEHRSTR